MKQLIDEYENDLKQIENRICKLEEKLKNPISAKEHDNICSRIAVLEKESVELIQNIHDMKAR